MPVISRPPFAVRVALVGVATGLLTPLFATVGVALAWHRLMPRGPFRAVTSALIGGGALTLCYKYVWPFLSEHAELVAPFALANGVASALWYGLIDAALGVEALGGAFSIAALFNAAAAAGRREARQRARLAEVGGFAAAVMRAPLPLGGVAVGVATATSAPLLWPLAIGLLWPPQLIHALLGGVEGSSALLDAYSYVFLPVALPVCLAAGVSMHLLLAPLVVGVPGVAWTRTALPGLLGLCALSASYMQACSTPLGSLLWELRFAPPGLSRPPAACPAPLSRNLLTAQLAEGAREAERSSGARDVLLAWQWAHEAWRELGRMLWGSAGAGTGAAQAWPSARGADAEAEAERAALHRLLEDVRGTAGAGAPAAAAAAASADPMASVSPPWSVPCLHAVSRSIEPLDCLMDLCLCAVLLAPPGRQGGAGPAAAAHGEVDSAEAALDAAKARASATLGVRNLELLAADLCAAAVLLRAHPSQPGRDESAGAARTLQPHALPEEAQAMTARLSEHAARLAGGTSSDSEARSARVLARALFAHVATFDARLRALGVSLGDGELEQATRRLRADERADAARRALAAAANVAMFAAFGALLLQAVLGGPGGDSPR